MGVRNLAGHLPDHSLSTRETDSSSPQSIVLGRDTLDTPQVHSPHTAPGQNTLSHKKDRRAIRGKLVQRTYSVCQMPINYRTWRFGTQRACKHYFARVWQKAVLE
jgi:hypothetical protein